MKHFRLLAVACAALLAGGCLMIDPRAFLAGDLSEVVLEEDPGWFVTDKIVLVDAGGIIVDQDAGGLFGGSVVTTPMFLRAALRRAEMDPCVRAVVLRIDSPGGTVSASEVMAREVKNFRARTGIPVYAHIQGLGCSGGYYLAAACDEIHIQPAGITGSIGVIAILPSYQKLADKVGYEQRVIKSGPLKDLGSAMRDLTDEERAVFQAMIDESYVHFIDWIALNRPAAGDAATIRKSADGRVFTAAQAKERKLVDAVCFLDESIDVARKAAGVTRADLVAYRYAFPSDDANMYSRSSASASARLLDVRVPAPLQSRAPGLFYLWQPGG